jgi:predicted ATPase
LLIEGEAGIGKSRLLEAGLELAAESGFAVYHGQAYEFERDRPFQAVADALGLIPEATDPHLGHLGRLLAGEAPASGPLDVSSHADLGFRIVEGVVSLLETLGSAAPVALGLDDLHAADSSSLRAVLAIGRRLPHLRLAILCTLRPSGTHPELDRAVEELLGRGARRLGVLGLDQQAVDALVVHQLGASPGPRLSIQLGGAAGNPLFVCELLTALEQEGTVEVFDGHAEVVSTSLPPSLRLTVLRRLSFLPSHALDVLRIAAVLGRSFSVGDLSTAVGLSAFELVPTLRQAVAAGLVGEAGEQLAFRHDLVREAIYEDVPLALRKELHRQVGKALASAGAPAVRVAAQLSMGASTGDMEAVGPQYS